MVNIKPATLETAFTDPLIVGENNNEICDYLE